jgi:drug/metabolite transporter (DMT)-like permease
MSATSAGVIGASPVDHRSERIGVLAAAAAAISFGAAFPATAVVLRAYTPLAAAATYSSLALLLMLGLAAAGAIPRPAPGWRAPGALARLCAVALVGGLGFIVGMSISVQLAGATVAGFVATLYSVFSAILAVPILGERLTPMALGSFVLALLGTALLADPGSLHGSVEGIVIALGAALCFGLYLVFARKWSGFPGMGGSSMALAVLVGRGPVLLAVEAIREPAALTPSGLDLAVVVAMAYLALVPGGLAQVFILASTRRIAARRTSAWLLLTPLTSATLALVLLGETPSAIQLAGGALVVLGIMGASGAADEFSRWISRSRAPT